MQVFDELLHGVEHRYCLTFIQQVHEEIW